MKQFDLNGTKLASIGTPGKAGSRLTPIQFGNVADVAFSADGTVFASDGDAGLNNRVVALARGTGALRYAIGSTGNRTGCV